MLTEIIYELRIISFAIEIPAIVFLLSYKRHASSTFLKIIFSPGVSIGWYGGAVKQANYFLS